MWLPLAISSDDWFGIAGVGFLLWVAGALGGAPSFVIPGFALMVIAGIIGFATY